VKFAPLLARADALGAEILATGHYARIVDGSLYRAHDPAKDQSYFLFAMGRATLSRVWFPLGETHKSDVRDVARGMALPNADTPDSQEICFVPDGDHGNVVERRASVLGVTDDALAPGPIVDEAGVELGTHRGIHRVTIGQRRGLGVAGERPRYVLRVIPESRTVVVGDAEHLARRELVIDDLRWLVDASDTLSDVAVQVRHRSAPAPADVVIEGSRARVTFRGDVSGIAPGQAAVVYRGEQVLAGGWIA
jgi:tRNA-specific 2-thiouridylase